MTTIKNNRLARWGVIAVVVLVAGIVLWRAPEEQTLGSGIKSVYIHVALTWTAMAGFVAAGLIGMSGALLSKPSWQGVAYTITWVSLGLFTAGFIMSFIAAGINWGGVFWQEPRTNSAIQIMVASLLVQILNHWSFSFRIKGFLYFLLLLFMLWSLSTIPDVLHPGDAARTAPAAIRYTFFGLFGLFLIAAGWFVWQIRSWKAQGSHL